MLPLNLAGMFGGGLSSGGQRSEAGDSSTGQNSSGVATNTATQTTNVRIYGGTGNSASAVPDQSVDQKASGNTPSVYSGSGDSVLVYVAIGIGVLALVVTAAKK